MTRLGGRKAFTLFEVLMALGVFGIAVIGMMMALNGALSAAREVRMSQLVRTELDNRIALLESEKPQDLDRTIEMSSPKITFVESIHPEPVTGASREVLTGFWRVQVLAKWQADGQPQEELASFLVYGP